MRELFKIGSQSQPTGGGGGGITDLNGLTATTQAFAVGTSGTDFAIVSASSTHTFNLPNASASARGVVSTSAQTFGGDKTFADDIIGDILKAVGAGGWTVKNNAGSDVALFGAGGSTGTSLLGATNIGSGSVDYVQVTGGTGDSTFTATGSSTDINIALVAKGAGYVTSNHGFLCLATGGSATDVDYGFGGAANLGFVRPSSNTIDLSINGTTAWRVNASRNMTIGGTTSPPNSERLFVSHGAASSDAMAVRSTVTTGGSLINFYDTSTNIQGIVGFTNSSYSGRVASTMQFGSIANVGVLFYQNNIERARIDTNGILLVGGSTTFAGTSPRLQVQAGGGGAVFASSTTASNGRSGIDCYTSSTLQAIFGYGNTTHTFAGVGVAGTVTATDLVFITENTVRHRINNTTRRMQLDSGLALPTTENTQTGTQTAIATLGLAGIRFTGALTNIQGFADGAAGSVLTLINLTGSSITVEHEDSSATAANRIVTSTGADVTWETNCIAMIWYVTSTSRWYFAKLPSA